MDGIALSILLIDDEDIVHQTLTPYLQDLGHRVDDALNGSSGLKLLEKENYDLVIIDIQMPGIDGLSILQKISQLYPEISSVIITGHGNMDMVIQALRLGAVDFLTKPVKLLEIDAILEKSRRVRSLRVGNRHLLETIAGLQTSGGLHSREFEMIGVSHAMKEVRRQVEMAVEANCDTILITGETGTGKEVVAREIHFLSNSPETPFIAVSCPAVPDTLVESELFGHVKGAFTGATLARPGYFEMADGGTLFLDEIGDLSQPAQAKLLRAIETRKFRRVGGSEEISVKIRIIAATNISLAEQVESKGFRQDLFYRLNLFTIDLLPLRERRADIMPLAEYFLSKYIQGRRLKIEGFKEDARAFLIDYDYPGNVRELRNIIERAAIVARSGLIERRHLSLAQYSQKSMPSLPISDSQVERREILKALEAAKWNRAKAAKALGITYSALRYKTQKLGIG